MTITIIQYHNNKSSIQHQYNIAIQYHQYHQQQEARPYKSDPEVTAMTDLVGAYQARDVAAFEKVGDWIRRRLVGLAGVWAGAGVQSRGGRPAAPLNRAGNAEKTTATKTAGVEKKYSHACANTGMH